MNRAKRGDNDNAGAAASVDADAPTPPCTRARRAGGLQLAVLHPRKLVVLGVQNMGSQYLQVGKLYEHHMEHTAANMCYGTFGGQKGR